MILFVKEHLAHLLELNGVIMAFTGFSILGLIGLGTKKISKNYKELKKRNEKFDEMIKKQEIIQKNIKVMQNQDIAQKKAAIVCLHNNIYSNYKTILNRNPPAVTMKELNNLECLWEAYSELGGDGTGQRMYDRICDLPIIDEGEEV